jgi:hypothetical protein
MIYPPAKGKLMETSISKTCSRYHRASDFIQLWGQVPSALLMQISAITLPTYTTYLTYTNTNLHKLSPIFFNRFSVIRPAFYFITWRPLIIIF